jgi:hypothetical protein
MSYSRNVTFVSSLLATPSADLSEEQIARLNDIFLMADEVLVSSEGLRLEEAAAAADSFEWLQHLDGLGPFASLNQLKEHLAVAPLGAPTQGLKAHIERIEA